MGSVGVRGRMLATAAIALALFSGGVVAVPHAYAATPAPGINYTFDGNTSDSAGGSALTVLGACPITPPAPETGDGQCNTTVGFGSDSNGTYWQWTSASARGGGFTVLTNAPLGNTYSIAMKFSFDTLTSSYEKIIDYENRVNDNGFYFYDREILFYPGSSGNTQYNSGQVLDLVATRNDATKEFIVYARTVGGGLETLFIYNDTAGDAVPIGSGSGSLLGFFFDDYDTSSEATDGGKVYHIQMWPGVALTQAEVEDVTTQDTVVEAVAGDQVPPPWLQSHGRRESDSCADGWHPSWAEWAVDQTGGWVCNRTIYWAGTHWMQNPTAVWGSPTPGASRRWDGS